MHFCIFRSPFTITEALLICSTMVFLSGLFSSPLFFSAGITTIISFDNFSSHSNGLTLNDFQICQPWSPDTVLREFRTKYQVVTCFLQFILPLISVVCIFYNHSIMILAENNIKITSDQIKALNHQILVQLVYYLFFIWQRIIFINLMQYFVIMIKV